MWPTRGQQQVIAARAEFPRARRLRAWDALWDPRPGARWRGVLDGRDTHPGEYGYREVVGCHASAAEARPEAARRKTRGERREVPVLAEARRRA